MAYKTPQQMFEEKQQSIKKAIAQKEKSIAFFNSVNATIALLGNKATKKKIQTWRDWFYQEWMDWAISNIVPEPTKLTAKDFVEAKAEAPAQQAKQDLADTLEEETIKEEEKLKQAEGESELPIIELSEEIQEEKVQLPKDAPEEYPE